MTDLADLAIAAHDAAYHPGRPCPEDQQSRCAARFPRPVPSPEDRMTAARQPGPTFATYLDRHDRDQLDARAAAAEGERDEALSDRDQAREDLRKLQAHHTDIHNRLAATEHDLRSQTEALRQALAERDERLTLAESSRLAKRYDQAEEDRDNAYRLLDQTTAALNVALHHANDNTSYAPSTEHYKARAAELGGCRIALQEATEAVAAPSSVPPRRAQEEPTAAHLAEHLYTHQWYSKPEFPLLHEPSSHREHIYNSDCAICRGDLSRIAAVALAYVQARP